MATPGEKLADVLQELHSLQEKGLVAIKSTEINRVNRELLVKTGYLKEVSKGWYTPSRPDERPGDSSSWYSSYWEFCGRFLEEKYGSKRTYYLCRKVGWRIAKYWPGSYRAADHGHHVNCGI